MTQIKHTLGPWNVGASIDMDTKKQTNTVHTNGDIIAYVGNLENAHLVAAAVNSYDKHCGSRALECAEGDLLGELLGALQEILGDADLIKCNTPHLGQDYFGKARAAIAKATGEN